MSAQAMTMSGMRQQVKSREHSGEHSKDEWNASLYAVQQRARRGPTPEVFYAKHLDNSRLVTEADPQRAREMRTFGIAMVALFLLVMVYVVQHFQSIEYGYKIESQKQQMEELSEQNRQLRLTEAELNAPLRLDAIAKSYGMDAPSPAQLVRSETMRPDSPPVLARAVMPTAPMAGQ
jgi:cell division protein FtsL